MQFPPGTTAAQMYEAILLAAEHETQPERLDQARGAAGRERYGVGHSVGRVVAERCRARGRRLKYNKCSMCLVQDAQ